jgi:hypothetical protein
MTAERLDLFDVDPAFQTVRRPVVGAQAGQKHQRRPIAEAQIGHAVPDRALSRRGVHRRCLPLLERNCSGSLFLVSSLCAGVLSRATALSQRIGRRATPGIGQGAPKEELDLRIRAAELVGSPPGQRVVDGRIEPEEDALALGHQGICHRATGTTSPR